MTASTTGNGRRRRRPRQCAAATAVLSLLVATASPVSAAASPSSAASLILGRDRDWWLDRVLLHEAFRFDGTHADFAQQFYRLFLDEGNATQPDAIDSGQLDATHSDAVAARLLRAINSSSPSSDSDALSLRAPAFADFSPLLQRAVLWDLGIIKAGDLVYTQVWTQCGLRMNELAVSKATYEAAGCIAQSCSTPTGALYYQSLQCNGFQIGNVSRCASARGKTPVHAAMWSNGGDEWTLPDSFVAKHEWSDAGNDHVVYGIHLAGDPNSYGKCVAPSMTVPCIAYEKLSADDRGSWCPPAPSRLVTQWIRAEHDIATVKNAALKKPPTLEIALSSVLAALVLLTGVWWIAKRQRERRRKFTDSGNTQKQDVTESEEDGAVVSYFFTEESVGGSSKRRGMGNDPHAMAVLGGCPTSFEKAPSFRREASAVGSSRRREDNSSFGLQHHGSSTGFAHGDTIHGCGAIYAGSVYGDSSGHSSRDRQPTSEKGDSAVFPLETDGSGPLCASSSSTYVSTNSNATTPDTFRWSATRSDDAAALSSDADLLASSSSGSSGKTTSTQKDHDTLSAITQLLQDPHVMAKRVPYVDVSVSRQLSKGAFGEVWVGRMRDKLVAVKRLIPERRKHVKDLDTFVAEIRLMAQFEHRNVMSLMGVAWNSPRNLCMMMEFLDNGDLQDLLKARSANELTWQKPRAAKPELGVAAVNAAGKKTSIAIDVASGLRYLHGLTPQIVHRDLKSHNILLSLELVAKLCDFGVSRVNEGIDTMTCGVGTAFWTAPEVLMGEKYTETADVYSFGVVLTELDTHHLPFHDAVDVDSGQRMEPIRVMHLVCMGEMAPTLTPECPSLIRDLARDCMVQEPANRPTLDEIIRRLTKFSRDAGVEDDPFLSERATTVSTGASSSNDPSSRRRTRLSSSFSIQDHDDGHHTSFCRVDSRRQSNDLSGASFDDSDLAESPRDSAYSDSGAVWI